MNSPLFDDIDAYLRSRGVMSDLTSARRAFVLATTPILWSLLVYRLAHARLRQARSPHSSLGWIASGLTLRMLTWVTNVATKTDLMATVSMDGGVVLSSQGHIILGAQRVGRGTRIGHRVTIGMSLSVQGLPDIGENVRIGENSVVYGPLKIGDGAVLLPGTVLTRSIPAGATVQGNPARLVKKADNAQPKNAAIVDD